MMNFRKKNEKIRVENDQKSTQHSIIVVLLENKKAQAAYKVFFSIWERVEFCNVVWRDGLSPKWLVWSMEMG